MRAEKDMGLSLGLLCQKAGEERDPAKQASECLCSSLALNAPPRPFTTRIKSFCIFQGPEESPHLGEEDVSLGEICVLCWEMVGDTWARPPQ